MKVRESNLTLQFLSLKLTANDIYLIGKQSNTISFSYLLIHFHNTLLEFVNCIEH